MARDMFEYYLSICLKFLQHVEDVKIYQYSKFGISYKLSWSTPTTHFSYFIIHEIKNTIDDITNYHYKSAELNIEFQQLQWIFTGDRFAHDHD